MAEHRDRIVVGVDGSEPSKHALRWALFLARTCGAEIEAVTAWTFPTLAGATPNWPDGWDPAADAATVLHDTVVETLGERPGAPVRETVVEGGAAHALLDIGAGSRVLVVGSRGHGGFTGLLLGSVSAACTEHATGAVLVVHGDTPPPP
ncbi:universal stress protein [Pseudonocardia sp. N23]|uniref:universal stress protein n=1 Tax=Pseudonocardia sp. N23 TaxID=1987376 RepID=UPI000BFD3A0A|nr:universal stress protein [Pseudonocardia sp. N23]